MRGHPQTTRPPQQRRHLIFFTALLLPAATSAISTSTSQALVRFQQQCEEVRRLRSCDTLPASVLDKISETPAWLQGSTKGLAEPSYSRMFTHETWQAYTGQPNGIRWLRGVITWPFSTVLQAVMPLMVTSLAWSLLCTTVIKRLGLTGTFGSARLPIELMGGAIGLLLVFRTNGAYERLAEARLLMSRAIFGARELSQGLAALVIESPRSTAADVEHALTACRYLSAFGWSLKARLRRDEVSAADVLSALFDPPVATWLQSRRHTPAALLGGLRRSLARLASSGALPNSIYVNLEKSVRDLALVVDGCDRLFSSPIPPTMSRHVLRSLVIWLGALPLVLTGTPTPVLAAFTVATTFIFVGIEVVGVQVEQPFEVMPLFQLATAVQLSVEESLVGPPEAAEEYSPASDASA